MEGSACSARSQREGTIPPPTPGATLGASESTSRRQSSTFDQGNPNAGGSGGGKGNIPPRNTAGAGNPGDSSDDSNSDPEVGKPPKEKATSEKLLEKYIDAMIRNHKGRDKVEAPKPEPYKGYPVDLERFLRQLENVWVLEPHKYKKDITKIRYAANLLHRNTTDKHRDPVKWYEAYHPKIDLAAAQRLPGGARATLDPVWSTWSVFVEFLRSSFATRVGREQAVNQWHELKDTDSIDDFLDSLTNLMWRTGYTEEMAKDQLNRGLNREVGLAWSQTPQKPRSLHEQMALIRDIGHSLENFKTLNKMNQDHHPKSNKNSHDSRQDQSGKERNRSEMTTDRKDKSVELKGIPADILEERKKAEMCLKCGKGPHKWFECFSKQPVMTKTVPKKKGIPQVQDTSKDKKKDDKKEVKISAVGMEDEYGGRIIELVTDSDGEYDILR